VKKVFYQKGTFNILLIPSMLIRTATALYIMTNPNFQAYIFESTEFIRRRKQILR